MMGAAVELVARRPRPSQPISAGDSNMKSSDHPGSLGSVATYRRMVMASWDFGDGRGLVDVEAEIPPDSCTCPRCLLEQAHAAALSVPARKG